MNSFKVIVSDDGSEISYLHQEALDLEMFGKKSVTRASDVEFDGEAQEWVATLMDGTEIARDKSRDRVLEREREHIEGLLSRGEPIPAAAPAR